MLLLGEFRGPLLLFITLVITCGIAYYYLSFLAGEPMDSVPAAIYLALSLTFFQSNFDFPHVWYLQIFLFYDTFPGNWFAGARVGRF